MKTISTTTVEYHEYSNEQAENLKKQTRAKLLDESKKAGQRDAEEGLPRKSDSLLTYLEPILTSIQQLISDLRQLHRAEETLGPTIEKRKEKLQTERNIRDELQGVCTENDNECKKVKDNYPPVLAFVLAGLVVCLGLMEGLFTTPAIRSFIPQYIIALIVASIYGLGLSILAHKIRFWWTLGRNMLTKWLIRGLIVGGFSIVFYLFGLLRSYQIAVSSLAIENTTSGSLFSLADPREALMFMLISWVIFLPAIIVAGYTPSKSEWIGVFKARSKRLEYKKSLKKLEAQKKLVDIALEDLENILQYDQSRLSTAIRDEQWALTLVALVRSTYTQSNLRHRPSNDRPDCFDKEFNYELQTYFQFSNDQEDNPVKLDKALKNHRKIRALGLLLIASLMVQSCTQDLRPALDITILTDVTQRMNRIEYKDVRHLMDFDRYMWNEHTLAIKEITDIEHGHISRVHLPMGNSNEQTENLRKVQIKEFLNQTQKILKANDKDTTGRQHSVIYKPVATELNRLARESNAMRKICIINSDLFENSRSLNLYTEEDCRILRQNPDSLARLFGRALQLDDLTGVEIYIIFRANPLNDEFFGLMSKLYSEMFIAHGAKVQVMANLTI